MRVNVRGPFLHAVVGLMRTAAKEAARIFEDMIPLRRHATPDEIARAVLVLATGGFVTGATPAVDPGMSI
jgi:NAD(P)-dependent dehydrogenase (short-subunit alcohol dehydrogenase family)